MRVCGTGTSVDIKKLALIALYPFGRSVLACETCITRTTVKLVAFVSFSDARRKKATADLHTKRRIYHCR